MIADKEKRAVSRRVGAIFASNATEVLFFGWGKYVGYEIPPPGIGLMGNDFCDVGHKTPKIILDNGKVVWGCECWWGAEDQIKSHLKGKRITEVDIEVERKKRGIVWLPENH